MSTAIVVIGVEEMIGIFSLSGIRRPRATIIIICFILFMIGRMFTMLMMMMVVVVFIVGSRRRSAGEFGHLFGPLLVPYRRV
jgi:hypothetical protein